MRTIPLSWVEYWYWDWLINHNWLTTECLSIRRYQPRVLINKRLSIDDAYQQLTLYIFVCQWRVCLFRPRYVNQGGVQKTTPQVTLYKPHTAEEFLMRSRAGRHSHTCWYCLAMRVKRGNSCWCCFHHLRETVSLENSCPRMLWEQLVTSTSIKSEPV
jgi:hypothetical protein